MRRLLLISLVLSLLSYQDEEPVPQNDSSFEITQKVYELDFFPNHMHSGVVFDRILDQELLYFGDLTTAKKIVFFDFDGNEIQQVDLKNIIQQTPHGVRNLTVIARDSILLMEEYTSTLILANEKGELNNKVDLTLFYPSDYLVEFNSSIFSDFSQNFLRDGVFVSYGLSPDNDFGQNSRIESLKSYYNQVSERAYFVQFKNVLDTIKIKSLDHLIGFKQTYSPVDHFTFEFSHYNVHDDFILFSSWYSDKLYIYDFHKQKMRKELKIESDYTTIGGTPFLITEDNLQLMDSLLKIRGSFNGLINRFFYDESNKNLFVQVYHEQKDRASDIRGAARPWSLLIYNDDLNKVFEKPFQHGEYSMGFTILTQKGLMLRRIDKNEQEFNKKNQTKRFSFDVFTFDL